MHYQFYTTPSIPRPLITNTIAATAIRWCRALGGTARGGVHTHTCTCGGRKVHVGVRLYSCTDDGGDRSTAFGATKFEG